MENMEVPGKTLAPDWAAPPVMVWGNAVVAPATVPMSSQVANQLQLASGIHFLETAVPICPEKTCRWVVA